MINFFLGFISGLLIVMVATLVVGVLAEKQTLQKAVKQALQATTTYKPAVIIKKQDVVDNFLNENKLK